MGQDGALTGFIGGLGGEELCGVGVLAGLVARVVEAGGLVDGEARGFEFHPAGGERVLDALVLADGPAEDVALPRVQGRAPQGREADADGFGGDQDAFGVHAVHDHLEAVVFLADQVRRGDFPVVEEQRVGVDGRAPHLGDLGHLDLRAVEVRVEQAEALAGLGDFVQRRRARQDQDLLRHLRGRDPDLLSAQEVVLSSARGVFDGSRLELQRVETRVGLGDAEACSMLTGDQRHQHATFLLVGPELPHGLEPEYVHVHRAGARVRRPALRDRLDHDGRLGDAQVTAAVLGRHADP